MPDSPWARPYLLADRAACLALFDANCPAFFAPNERPDYVRFLEDDPAGYEVWLDADQVIGAHGVNPQPPDALVLRWILVSPHAQGRGLGSAILARARATLVASGTARLLISASHRSAPFFVRFGARELSRIQDGWGPGMHRVEMELTP
jgi:GNAT superfamily N-acetyltransferase